MATHSFQKQRLRLGLTIAPILAAGWIIPIFVTSGNPWYVLPIVWTMGTLMTGLLWMLNIQLEKRWIYHKNLRYIFSFLLVATLMLSLRLVVDLFLNPPSGVNPVPTLAGLAAAMAINAVVLILQELMHLRWVHFQTEKENAELKLHNMEAQFQNLKNQLQPHFLFNALSTLKTLIKRQPAQAEQYVVQLADFLRAALITEQKQRISLEEDLQIALNYLNLQMMRFRDSIFFENRLPEKLEKQQFVPPFTLQMLVENALKHTSFSPEKPLRLWIEMPEIGEISVTNNLQPKQANPESSSYIGLDNLSKRFALLGGQDIEISQNESDFKVVFRTLLE